MTDFDYDFSSPQQWADMYRSKGIQVVPALAPGESEQWKRPAVAWRVHENDLIDDQLFSQWYDATSGQYRARVNMGIVTGVKAHGQRYWVLDLDTSKTDAANEWWIGLLSVHNNGMAIETWTQRTQSGGLQLVFTAPDWWTPPTGKTPLGVDIRGHGGFAMLPPSQGVLGTYQWLDGTAPWDMDAEEAPTWLCNAVDALLAQHGRSAASGADTQSQGPITSTPTPEAATDAFGAIVDGREDYMTRLIWGRVLDLYREAAGFPIAPTDPEHMRDAWQLYERNVKSRIREPGTANHVLLEREGRGITLFTAKWNAAIGLWNTKVAEAASHPSPKQVEEPYRPDATPPYNPETGEIFNDFSAPSDTFEALDISQIKRLPDPEWLISGLIIEKSLNFIPGAPGSGKSFIAIGMALSIASNQPQWFERDINRHGPVIYVSPEGTTDMKHRIMAWEQGSKQSVNDVPFYLVHQSINFMQRDDINRLLRTIESVSNRAASQPALIVVDTVSRVLPGADENAAKEITLFIKACDEVRETFGCAVLGVHHVAKSTGTMRGSSVLDGAADSILSVTREEGEEVGYLTAKKIKAAADGWKQAFRLALTDTGDVKGTKSLYAHITREDPPQADAWPSKEICQKVLDAMSLAWNSDKPWSNAPQTRHEGRHAVQHIIGWGITSEMAATMIEAWLVNNVISLEVHNKNTKARGLRVIGRADNGWKPIQEAE